MLSIGIVGLPNVGKSTLFNALTNSSILAANYPFATIEPNTGIVPVPDNRLDELAKLYSSKKIIPATVTFVDIAGLVAGASKGEGLGNKFLANIRQCSAILHVIRAFDNNDVIHVENRVDPKSDIEIINTELIMSDVETIDNKIPKLQKEAKAKPAVKTHLDYLESIKRHLLSGTPLSALPSLNEDYISELNLLTAKPIIYLFNVDEKGLGDFEYQSQLTQLAYGARTVFVCAQLEEELKGLDKNEAKELLQSYQVDKTGLEQLANVAYDILGLQSYLTAGEQEVRAWTIHKGDTAPKAAGVIHTDFEKGFIAAEIVDFDELIACGSEQAAKAAGKIKLEGRDYVMRPGDVVEFRFNVSK